MKNRNVKKIIFIISIAVILLFAYAYLQKFRKIEQVIQPNDRQIGNIEDFDTKELISKAEDMIIEKMNRGRIPGLSVAIVKNGETVYKAGFGYANMEAGKKVTSDTLFQIGSNSKAFTALGVFQLQKDGLIDLNDPISKYIPWLKFFYNGNEADVAVADFLHHTSGFHPIRFTEFLNWMKKIKMQLKRPSERSPV